DDVTLMGAGSDKGSRHEVGPVLDILPGVTDYRGFSGGAAGSMDPDDLFQRCGKQRIGIRIAHILLGGERKLLQVGQRLDGVRCQAERIKGGAVKRDVTVNSFNHIFKSLELQGFESRPRKSLKFIIEIAWHDNPS